ncbi:MAG: DUF222 domain-containing protein [Candidatus Nanopelagicales bacterium]
MSSSTPPGAGTVTVPELCAAVEQIEAGAALIAGALADRERLDLGSVPTDVVADLTVRLLRAADRITAAGTVTAGHVDSFAGHATGTLISGVFASTRRWLEVAAGAAPSTAKALLARARDLREHSEPVEREWLRGEITGDAVRELTSGVSGVLRQVTAPREEKAALRAEAIDVLLPVARLGTPGDLKRAIGKLRLLADSAGEAKAVVEAYDDQSLTWAEVGALTQITAWLTHENAAALLTVIGRYAQQVVERSADVGHDPTCPLAGPPVHGSPHRRWCDCGASQAAGLSGKDRWDHALAVAAGELAHDLLARGDLGTHHGVAPHVTVQVTLAELEAGMGGELVTPGSDATTVLGSETVRRILCDADVTPVIVDELRRHDDETRFDVTDDSVDAADGDGSTRESSDRRRRLSRLLLSTAIAVLYVGRSKRTVTPAQRRALEARDRHCIFPGCRAHPRRCHAHHVCEWEHDGCTDLDNLALLCVRHHISVHEGGWRIMPTPGVAPNETGYWTVHPPPRPQP